MECCERIKLEEEEKGSASIHLVRYHFASPFCAGKRVLDCATGTGYGSTVIAKSAASFVGVDIDPEAIAYASNHYLFPNVHFQVMNAERMNFPDHHFDIVLSFETIEHLKNSDAYLHEIVRTLDSNGMALISTPNVRETTLQPKNPHHVRELNRSDFGNYLGRFFGSVEMFGVKRRQSPLHRWFQRLDPLHLRRIISKNWRSKIGRTIGTAAFHDMELVKDILVEPYTSDVLSMIALCSQPKKKSS